jgi:hypothetical protein
LAKTCSSRSVSADTHPRLMMANAATAASRVPRPPAPRQAGEGTGGDTHRHRLRHKQ